MINFDGVIFLDLLLQNVNYFDFSLTIGMTDELSYWSASNISLDDDFIYISQAEQPNSIVFNLDRNTTINIINQNIYYSHVVDIELSHQVTVFEESEAIYLLASYNLDDLLLLSTNIFYIHPLLKFIVSIFSGLLISGIMYFVISKFSMLRIERIYGFISDFSNDGILITDSKKHTIYTNTAFNTIFGVSPNLLIGKQASNRISAEHRLIVPVSQTRSTGSVWDVNGFGDFILLKIHLDKIYNIFGNIKNHVALYQPADELIFGIEDLDTNSKSNFNKLVIDFFKKQYHSIYKDSEITMFLLEQKNSLSQVQDEEVLYSHFKTLSNVISANFNVKTKYYISNKLVAFFIETSDSRDLNQVATTLRSLHMNDSILELDFYSVVHKLKHDDLENSLKVSFLMLELSKILNSNITTFNQEYYETYRRHTEIIKLLDMDFTEIGFYMDYQTKRCTSNSEIHSVEALLRIRDPKLGRIAPNEFIPIIENMNKTKDLIPIIMGIVFNDLDKNNISSESNINVTINLSVADLEVNHLIANIIEPILDSKYAPSMFGFEITETILVKEISKAESAISLLRSYGFKLLLDDFGIGYSSLSYISQLNFDVIKIDRHFISESNVRTATVLETIVLLCKQLNIKSVIEGVETIEQLNKAKQLGIDYYQGFYDSIPMSFDKAVIIKK